jgi:hypothetical protein
MAVDHHSINGVAFLANREMNVNPRMCLKVVRMDFKLNHDLDRIATDRLDHRFRKSPTSSSQYVSYSSEFDPFDDTSLCYNMRRSIQITCFKEIMGQLLLHSSTFGDSNGKVSNASPSLPSTVLRISTSRRALSSLQHLAQFP